MNSKPTKTVIVDCAPDGTVTCLHEPEAEGVMNYLGGIESTQRVTHVEPSHTILRSVFRLCRWTFNSTSLIADFTRSWGCDWDANIIDGPTLGPFSQRQSAIDAERTWLIKNIFHYGE